MRLVIDGEQCQGHGRCALICPEVFDVSEAGLGIVKLPVPDEPHLAQAQRAVDNCPEQAISWVE